MKNTIIFAIGSFSSKLLTFLLTRFYTEVLTTAELGVADLIVQTSNLILPIVLAGMASAMIRFGLDRSVNKRSVFTGGVVTVFFAYLLFLLLYPVLRMIPVIESHTYLIYLFVLAACMRALCSQFVRSLQLVRLYAFDGILSTVTMIAFNLVFLLVFKMGITGYVLATICSDALSSLFLFFSAKLHRFFRPKWFDGKLLREMLQYAVPLIPTTVLWMITNVSDRYFITYMIGAGASGIYAVAQKIPTIITIISGIFTDAWQMSAFSETNRLERERFFSNVFRSYLSVIMTAASGLIFLARWLNYLLASEEFYISWRDIPLLILATTFSCLVSFLGSIYMAEKKSIANLLTALAGALLNLLLNWLLIPEFKTAGAAAATFLSYLLVFILRAIDTRRYLKLRWNPLFLAAGLAILLGQTYLLLTRDTGWVLPVGGLCLLMVILNMKQLLQSVYKILQRRSR